jgi:hypothetical protein
MVRYPGWTIALLLCWTSLPRGSAAQQHAPPMLPVREITVFKDGHAFVLHAGSLPVDAGGNVPMDYLPTPVLGTFWPYSDDRRAQLVSVTSGWQKMTATRPALSLRELLTANPGAAVTVVQKDGLHYSGQIVGVPERSPDTSLAPLDSGPRPSYLSSAPVASNFVVSPLPQAEAVLLKTQGGVLALPFDQIKTVTFKGPYKRGVTETQWRPRMTLKLDWNGRKPDRTASVGMVYLQRGIRWIPNYKITLDGQGNAVVKLQATILNEMIDLQDVTAHLVIGVPTFALQDSPDPISLQQTFPALSRYFPTDSQTGYALSNSIMSQVGGVGGGGGFGGQPGGAPADILPGNVTADKNEDLFLFTVRHITLKKGQSMVVPVAEYTLPYRDVYVLEVRPRLRSETQPNMNPEQASDLTRLLSTPKALHKIRLTNRSPYPLTTAPALILHAGRVVAQAMTTYTAVGSEGDVTLTTATDIKVKKTEQETGRTPNALSWRNEAFEQVAMAGTLTITNFGSQPVDLEVTRTIQGHVDSVDHDGTAEMIPPDEEGLDFAWDTSYYPATGINGVGRFAWKLRLSAGESADVKYTWHYFTR